jgi:transcription-repair coupling factor (superfamily II helicase)
MCEFALPAAPLYVPTDRKVVRAREIARRASATMPGSPVAHYEGMAGCMAAVVARAIARADARPIVCVTRDAETARQLADDLAFLGAGAGETLIFSHNEVSPYADVSPDRRAATARLVTLFHLSHGLPWRFLVVSAAGLVRKVVPRSVVQTHSSTIALNQEVDRDQMTAHLVSAGYVRVPLVEDPATFAVRGAVVDVWPACETLPIRIELYGDRVLSVRPFDPAEQRSMGSGGSGSTPPKVGRVWFPLARESAELPSIN